MHPVLDEQRCAQHAPLGYTGIGVDVAYAHRLDGRAEQRKETVFRGKTGKQANKSFLNIDTTHPTRCALFCQAGMNSGILPGGILRRTVSFPHGLWYNETIMRKERPHGQGKNLFCLHCLRL